MTKLKNDSCAFRNILIVSQSPFQLLVFYINQRLIFFLQNNGQVKHVL